MNDLLSCIGEEGEGMVDGREIEKECRNVEREYVAELKGT